MSYILQKPFTSKQKADFIVKYNHRQGLRIEETEEALFALEPYENLLNGEVVDNSIEYEAQLAHQERERLAMLNLTAADVERAIYQAKGIDFDDIIQLVSANPPENFDVKALKIELKANNFYRGNPYIDAVGALLGLTPEMLDQFFKTNDYTKLLPDEIEPQPETEPAESEPKTEPASKPETISTADTTEESEV